MSATARVLLLAIVLLGLSAPLKSVLWDDVVYYDFAHHILQHPLDPYGASIWVLGNTIPASSILAPAGLLYWWAGAMAVLGTGATLSTLGLFPFAALYCIAFFALCRRFAPAAALPLTIAATLSPWALVSFSYMLDFSAVALGLCALAVFVHGSDRGRVGLVAVAGFIAGLALQTKYSAAAIPAAMIFYGVVMGRPVHGLLAAALAGAVFWAWEAFVWMTYGQSHFLMALGGSGGGGIGRLRMLLYGLIENAGPTAIAVAILAAAALQLPRRIGVPVVAGVLISFIVAALGFDRVLGHVIPGLRQESLPTLLTLSGLSGIALWAMCVALIFRFWHSSASEKEQRRAALFLIGWLAIEVAVYFAMSPFPAARRIGEIVAVLLLICGAALQDRTLAGGKAFVRGAVAASVLSGFAMLGIAAVDSANVRRTARATADLMRAQSHGGGTWQAFGLTFDFFSRSEGLTPLEFGKSVLQPGDLLAVEQPVVAERLGLSSSMFEPVAEVRAGINLGVRVSTDFYRAQLPWMGAPDTRPAVAVFRVKTPVILQGIDREPKAPPNR